MAPKRKFTTEVPAFFMFGHRWAKQPSSVPLWDGKDDCHFQPHRGRAILMRMRRLVTPSNNAIEQMTQSLQQVVDNVYQLTGQPQTQLTPESCAQIHHLREIMRESLLALDTISYPTHSKARLS